MNQILKDLHIVKNNAEGNLIQNLYTLPKEPKQRQARVSVPTKNQIYQADLLYLPEDDGYKYALVVVDCANHAMDAAPLRTKTNAAVLEGFKTIFKGKYLSLPQFSMEVDDGKEFKDTVKQYFRDKGVILRVGKPYRHRQQAVVEWMNYILGKILFMLMTVDELDTGETSKDWVKDLPAVVAAINKHLTIQPRKPVVRNVNETILPVGTLVRYALDAPINVADESKLIGKFRAGDIRWSIKPVKITEFFLRPDQPTLYAVEGNKANTYTRDQLQVYNEMEETPKPRKFVVEALVGKSKVNNRIVYRVKFKGFSEAHNKWLPKADLMATVPELVKAYDKT